MQRVNSDLDSLHTMVMKATEVEEDSVADRVTIQSMISASSLLSFKQVHSPMALTKPPPLRSQDEPTSK